MRENHSGSVLPVKRPPHSFCIAGLSTIESCNQDRSVAKRPGHVSTAFGNSTSTSSYRVIRLQVPRSKPNPTRKGRSIVRLDGLVIKKGRKAMSQGAYCGIWSHRARGAASLPLDLSYGHRILTQGWNTQKEAASSTNSKSQPSVAEPSRSTRF